MSPKPNFYNSNSKRFDFGVPLEDVFPPNDVHPRLKYLFEEAYSVSLESGLTIDKILRQFQGPLEMRLKLKEKIVYDVHYHIKRDNIDDAPGAYFWAIRHFLGLLPIPLLPKHSRGMQFDWIYLSEQCHKFLRHYENDRRQICQLDYKIAENLNLLPFEHFLLLFVLILFMRKVSLKPTCRRQISRRTLVCLAKYYCAAIGSRPYRLGDNKNEKLFPFLFYLLLRWRYIEKNCRKIGHPAYFLETDSLNFNTYRGVSIRDSSVQTISFSPDVITVYKNVPYICDNNCYLKDTECQTEASDFIDKDIEDVEIVESSKIVCTKVLDGDCRPSLIYTPSYKNFAVKANVESSPVVVQDVDETFGKDIPLDRNSTKLDKIEIDSIKFLGKVVEEEYDIVTPVDDILPVRTSKDNQVEQIYPYKVDLTFVSQADNDPGWSDVVVETMKTVKKVEEYIYDDYETFNKEDYNQISSKKNDSSLFDKISKIGWTYTPKDTSKMTSTEESNSQRDESQTYFHHSYYKFEDVFENDGSFKTIDDENSGESAYFKDADKSDSLYRENASVKDVDKNDSLYRESASVKYADKDDSVKTIQTIQSSETKPHLRNNPFYGTQEKYTDDEPKSKKTFSLKRFKINLDFLRILTPRNIHHTPSYGSIESNVKYKKIKNVKSTIF